MKNKYFSFVALAAAALATSCASDDLAEQKQNQTDTHTVTLTASVNEGQTRVGMKKESSANASFYWHSGDKILVQTVNGSTYGGAEFKTSAETGATSAAFTGTVDSDSKVGSYAVYPYSTSHAFTATTLTYNLPASYTYTSVESNIFSKTTDGTTSYPSNPINMPMLGTISDKSISFKCLGGLAVIRIDQMPAAEGTLTVTADQQLSGDFTVSDLSATDAQIATTTASDGNNTVTFNFTGAETGKVGVFYLPLATGSYSGVKIVITYGDDNSTTQTINYGNLYVERKSVTAIPLYTIDKKLTKFSAIDTENKVYTLNGRKFIDLGLDVLWAEMNIGADNTTDYYGTYCAQSATAKICSAWCTPCRMPTVDEINSLTNSTNRTWTTNKDGSGVNGYEVTSKVTDYTSQSIFFPATGFYYYSYQKRDNNGYYWSSVLNKALSFDHDLDQFGQTDITFADAQRCLRAVTEK